MFENKNKVCVGECGASRQSESISIYKNKAPLYYYRGLSGAHLDITSVISITGNV